MATSGDIVCGVCEVEHITKDADHWCPECEQGLCSQCLRYHNALKSSRNHGIISIDSYKQLPPSIINIKQYCPDHDRKFKNYCPQHECLCCPLCIPANHKDCRGILALEEIIKSFKTSTLLDSMERSIQGIKINMDKIIENKKQNLATIKNQRQKFQDEIKEMRGKIIKHLDKLEQQILEELSTEETKVKLQIENIFTKLLKNSEKVDMLQSNITTIKRYASDMQAFLGSRTIDADIQRQEKTMQAFFDDESVNEIYLKCKIEDKIKAILSEITSFGTVSTEVENSPVFIKTEKDRQAQIVFNLPTHPKTIHDIKLVVQWKINLKEIDREAKCVRGCTFTNSRDIILAEYLSGRLLVLREDGSFNNEISSSITYLPDVTCIDDRTVAVSSHEQFHIEIIDIIDKNIVRTIPTTYCCSGISYRNGFLYYAEHSKGIYKVQLQNDVKSLLIPRNTIFCWDYLTLSDDKIYQTIHEENRVCCHTLSGQKIWDYNDVSMLKEPCGVTIDKSSNIYVASATMNRIIVISPEGKKARCILGEEDGINSPYGICTDKEKNNLLVANDDGTVILYKLT